MSTTLSSLVRKQILDGGPDIAGPDIASERDWLSQMDYDEACERYVDGALDSMSNVELLERISSALEELNKPHDRRVWI
jgi:hypothetical protein